MNIKRIGLCVLALIVVGISYWLAVGVNYDTKTVRIDPEAHTLVNSSDAIISKRILAMKSIDSQVYFLGYEGLAAFPDSKFQTKQNSHGLVAKKKYGVNGAYEEAVLGYPNLAHALTSYESFSTDSKEQKQLHMLLVLMSTIEDTCVLHRSDETTLFKMQKLAYDASKRLLPNPSFSELLRFCQKKQISPGGSADLLAAGIFLVEVKSWEKKSQGNDRVLVQH